MQAFFAAMRPVLADLLSGVKWIFIFLSFTAVPLPFPMSVAILALSLVMSYLWRCESKKDSSMNQSLSLGSAKPSQKQSSRSMQTKARASEAHHSKCDVKMYPVEKNKNHNTILLDDFSSNGVLYFHPDGSVWHTKRNCRAGSRVQMRHPCKICVSSLFEAGDPTED